MSDEDRWPGDVRGCGADHALRDPRRHLEWDGCFNVRDVGGLPTGNGRATAWGALVRSDSVHRLTGLGWEALSAYGVRTIVDLRNDDELEPDLADRPSDVTTVRVPHDGIENTEFWDRWSREPPPLYYGPHLERFPDRSAAVIAAIAAAKPGGVVVHCVTGRDRTGLITMVVLSLMGTPPTVIADEHALSAPRLAAFFEARGEDDQGAAIRDLLGTAGATEREVIVQTLESVDVGSRLRDGGLGDAHMAALQSRLLP